jgi:hypothetical protein
MITNQDEKEFAKEYGSAILDRLRPVIVRFSWESRRETLDLKPVPEPEKQEKTAHEEIDF